MPFFMLLGTIIDELYFYGYDGKEMGTKTKETVTNEDHRSKAYFALFHDST
jgi:hypothetical protein